jgi:5-methylcytosine-specific restriction endonuclease McrA
MSRRRKTTPKPVDSDSTTVFRRDRREVSSLTRDMIMARDGYCCRECDNVACIASGGGEPVEKLEVCYVIAPEDGGNNSMSNLITLCVPCIVKRGDEPIGGPYDGYQGL